MNPGSGARQWMLAGLLAAAMSVVPTASTAVSPAAAGAFVALQTSADLGQGEKVSAAASAPGGPVVPDGCRTFGHWVSSEARGTTCQDNPRPGRPQAP